MTFKFKTDSITANNDTAPVNSIGLNTPNGVKYLSGESGSLTFGGEVIGGGGVSDYDDLKNRPCGFVMSDIVELIPLTDAVYYNGLEAYVANCNLDVYSELLREAEYTVIYNGVQYNTTGTVDLVNKTAFFGNHAMMDGTGDTGEPFVIMILNEKIYSESGVYIGNTAIMPLDGASSVTFSMSGRKIKKRIELDQRLVPPVDLLEIHDKIWMYSEDNNVFAVTVSNGGELQVTSVHS